MTWFNDAISSLRIWNKGHDYMVPVVSSVGNGAKGIGIRSVIQTVKSKADGGTNKILVTLTNGDSSEIEIKNGSHGSTFTFNDLTEEQIRMLKTNVSTSYYKKIEETYVPTTTIQTINLPSGFRDSDVITVDINGLNLIDGIDYVIDYEHMTITFTDNLIADMQVHFTALRSVAVVEEDYERLKGDKGDKGDTGSFGTPVGSVDNQPGVTDPSVDIIATGPDTAKVFNFRFHNLKGNPFVFSDFTAEQLEDLREGITGMNCNYLAYDYSDFTNGYIDIPTVDIGVNFIQIVFKNGLLLLPTEYSLISNETGYRFTPTVIPTSTDGFTIVSISLRSE